MKKKVFIRVDGSPNIGLGHIVRCMSLAHMLKNDFSIYFFVKEIPISLKDEITQNGWNVTFIEKELKFLNDLTGVEIVVLDGYQFDTDYQKQIKKSGCKLVFIDDFHNQHFYADLVINHTPGIRKQDYEGESYTKYLLGPDFALLRPEFLERQLSDKKNYTKDVKNVFICFGGSDVNNLTAKILSWLPSKSYSVTVVLGNAYIHQYELGRVVEERKDLDILIKNSLSAKYMREELERADIAIVPASGIAFEAISINIPLISGYYADNQFGFYNWLRDEGLIFFAENFNENSFKMAMNNIDENKANDIVKNQSRIIDRESGIRLRDEIQDLSG